MENELDELRSIQATSTPEPYREAQPLPWWKRRLLQMQTQDIGQGIQQAQGVGGESVVNNWASLGKGVGNLAKKLVGMEQGGVVQGPTHVLAGEAGEAEAFVPESKAIPFALETLRTGKMPNPASLPRTEKRPPPPVILANTPAMACGGKVIPKMADGGVIDPFLNADPFAVPDFSASPMRALPPIPTAPPAPATQGVQSSAPPNFSERKRLQELVAQGAPAPRFYDRLFMGEGNGPMDMRPGVAPYSIAGRAAGKIIGSLLPYNKKRDEYQRQIEAAKVGVQNEDAQNAANERLAQTGRAERVADAQIEADRARAAHYNAQANQQPPPPKRIPVDVNIGGKPTPVLREEGTGKFYSLNGQEINPATITSLTLPETSTPKETPEQATARRNKEADDFIAKGLWKKGSTEDINYRAGRNVSRPAKTGGAGGASASTQASLSSDEERMAKAVADGTYDPAKVTGKNKNSILARAADLGYSPTPKYSAKEKEDLENLKVLSDAVDKLIGGPSSTTKEAAQRQSALKSGVGLWDGTVGAWLDKKVGWGADGKVVNARQLLGIVTGALAKAQGGASFTPTERELMERYTPTQDESDESVIAKLKGLRDFLKTKRSAIESLNAIGPARIPNADRTSGSATANAPTPPFPGAVLMQAPGQKDPVWVAPDKVESAIKKGAKRI